MWISSVILMEIAWALGYRRGLFMVASFLVWPVGLIAGIVWSFTGELVLRDFQANYCDRGPRCYVPSIYRNDTDVEQRDLKLETTDEDVREQEH